MNTGGRTFNVVYTTSGAEALYCFRSIEAARQWKRDVNAIKFHISSINNKLVAEGRLGQGTLEDYGPWINRCKDFIFMFGKEAVPLDIRQSMNSVENGCGVEETTWPAN